MLYLYSSNIHPKIYSNSHLPLYDPINLFHAKYTSRYILPGTDRLVSLVKPLIAWSSDSKTDWWGNNLIQNAMTIILLKYTHFLLIMRDGPEAASEYSTTKQPSSAPICNKQLLLNRVIDWIWLVTTTLTTHVLTSFCIQKEVNRLVYT